MKFRQQYVIPLIFAITAAPFVIAWFLVNFTEAGHSDTPGHGTLLDPPRQLKDAALLQAGGGEAHLHGKWTLLYLARGECAADCLQQLGDLRELRLATGRNMHRVQRVLAVFDTGAPLESWVMPDELRGQLLVPAPQLADDPGAAFAIGENDRPVSAQRVYLVDPLGRLMMAYPSGTDAAGIVRDLKRLLRYSRIG